MPITFASADEERDAIFSLLAVAAVAATWDESPLGEGQGHNIGALLVDKNDRPVAFARNESSGRRDLTEHAELRLIRGHIAGSSELTELHKHSIYTTLEPCAMCAGMMAMTNVQRAVYAQPDPLYGGVFERLGAGPNPYPKTVEARIAPADLFRPLIKAFINSDSNEVIEWLPSPSAREAFATYSSHFGAFEPKFEENSSRYDSARRFLEDLA